MVGKEDFKRIHKDNLERFATSKYALFNVNQFSPQLLQQDASPLNSFFNNSLSTKPSEVLDVEYGTVFPGSQLRVVGKEASIYTKRTYRFPRLDLQAQFDPDYEHRVRFKPDGARQAGLTGLRWDAEAGELRGHVDTRGHRASIARLPNDWVINDIHTGLDPTEKNTYHVVCRRKSVEFWWGVGSSSGTVNDLLGIVQTLPTENQDSYEVRNAKPYYLAQISGFGFDSAPLNFEWHYDSAVETDNVFRVYAGPGDPDLGRSLEPYTDTDTWAGTSIDSGTLTSDRLPCAGFDKVIVYFKADGSGTLDLNADYGFDALDEYDSVSVSADALETYIVTGEIPWLQLEFTPDSYPTTVTRALVVMKG